MQSRRYDAGYPTFEHSSLILPTQSTTLKRDHLPAWIKVEQILELFKAHRRGKFPWNRRNEPLSEQVSESEFELIWSKLDDDIELRKYVVDKVR